MIAMLGSKALRRCSWRCGTKGMLSARFAAVRVCVADGVLASHWQHLPGQAAWLTCEARSSGERKYYFTNHAPNTPRRTLVRAIKARWACEQAHQQLKDELGLDHYEGRSWLGLHDHALLTMMAFTYLQHRRLVSHLQAGKKNKSQCPGSATPANTASGTPRHSRRAASRDSPLVS
jgi:SRSO17 transposase